LGDAGTRPNPRKANRDLALVGNRGVPECLKAAGDGVLGMCPSVIEVGEANNSNTTCPKMSACYDELVNK